MVGNRIWFPYTHGRVKAVVIKSGDNPIAKITAGKGNVIDKEVPIRDYLYRIEGRDEKGQVIKPGGKGRDIAKGDKVQVKHKGSYVLGQVIDAVEGGKFKVEILAGDYEGDKVDFPQNEVSLFEGGSIKKKIR
jgi:hypothetical protein